MIQSSPSSRRRGPCRRQPLAAPAVLRAETRTVKMGALRLVHSMPPYFYEKFAPAGPQDRDHRVRQPDRRQECRGHQVGRFRHLRHRRRHPGRRGGRAGRGRGRACPTRAWASSPRPAPTSRPIKDLKGKRVGIWPGSTQEVFILERLRWRACRSRTSRRCACRSARCRPCWRAATSTPMSAPSRARRSRSPRARASSSNIRIRRRWAG